MIELVVVLLVLGAAAIVFYPALMGTAPRRPVAKGRGAKPVPMDAETAEILAGMVERKNRLLRNLVELEAERAAGRIGEEEFAELQRRDEIAAARAIHELEVFEAEARSGKKKGRHGGRAPVPAGRRLGTTLAWVGGTVGFAAVLVFTMSKAVTPRAAGGTITGTIPGAGEPEGGGGPPSGAGSPMLPRANPARLAELEKVISRDSSNLKALLEAGHLYLAELKLDQAAAVTIRALQQDPETPEGHAHIAMLLFAEAQSQQDPDSATRALDGALDAVNHAIQTQPDLAEAWLFKGMIMMAGKRDMQAAAQAWQQYLKIAPPDADTTRIHAIVESAKRAAGR